MLRLWVIKGGIRGRRNPNFPVITARFFWWDVEKFLVGFEHVRERNEWVEQGICLVLVEFSDPKSNVFDAALFRGIFDFDDDVHDFSTKEAELRKDDLQVVTVRPQMLDLPRLLVFQIRRTPSPSFWHSEFC